MIKTLGWVDYLVWIALLVSSLGIGFYFWFIERLRSKKKIIKNETTEFLLGGRQMNGVSVACSIMASFFSAVTLLGIPNDIYQNGVMIWFIAIAFVFSISISAMLFVPVFYNLQITSSYEYLGLRFSKINQSIAALAFIFQMTPYLGIVLYGPSLALNLVLEVNIWIIIVSTGVVCIIYTTVGGIKAVIWTDVLQLMMMFLGMFGIIIKGSIYSGGIVKIIETAYKHERMSVNFSFDPRTRHSLLGMIIGGGFLWGGIYAINQTMIQRALCIKSLKQAKLAYFLNIPGINMLIIIVVLCGFVIFHTFSDCDPLIVKEIQKSDQLVPLYVSKYLLQYPGIGGIFIAGIFSGGLSTMSSGLNSLAAVTLHDIIMLKYKTLSDRHASIISKSLVIIYGILILLFCYLCSLTSKILQVSYGVSGMLSGPSLGVFSLGLFLPFTNYKGAITGHIISQIVVLWIGFGSYANDIKHPGLRLSNFNCSGLGNFTNHKSYIILANNKPIEGIQNLYAISYLWYSLIGWLIVLLVGIPVSLLTKSEKDTKVQIQFISPPFQNFWKKYLVENYEIQCSYEKSKKNELNDIPSKLELKDYTSKC